MTKDYKHRKKKKINWASVALWSTVYLALAFGGFCLGLVYEQVLIAQEAAYIMRFADLHVDINMNATKFAEELNRTFIPEFKQALNESAKVKK